MAEWVRHEGGAVAEWVRHEGVQWQSGLDMKGCSGRVG